MSEKSVLCPASTLILSLFTLFSCLFRLCNSMEQLGEANTFTVSSFEYPETQIRPFDMRYIRVDLPPWFSSMSIALESSVNLHIKSVGKVPKSELPMICFREGSLPLPDDSSTWFRELVSLSNSTFEGTQVLQNSEQCYPVPRNVTMKLTNDQISARVLYFGLFNGVGPTRTQSKMIVRGPSYSFAANITVEGCVTSTMQGQYCNQTVEQLSCGLSRNNSGNGSASGFFNQSMVSCWNNFETSCLEDEEIKIYTLEILQIAEFLTISAEDPLCMIILVIGGSQRNVSKVCYSLDLQELECPLGKAGPNCLSERYMLQE
ncbi:hypothetical protein V6N13_022048 [Hibiscus sabdariffa]